MRLSRLVRMRPCQSTRLRLQVISERKVLQSTSLTEVVDVFGQSRSLPVFTSSLRRAFLLCLGPQERRNPTLFSQS